MSELRGIEMPQLSRAGLPEGEAQAISTLQDSLDTLAAHARTFTAAAEMLSFAQQRAATHEAQFTGDNSAMAKERRNLLAEWQNIAVREGAMSLFHFAATMDGIALALNDCPMLSAAIDQSRLLTAGRRFRQGFPGFKAAGREAAPLPAPAPPTQIGFSQSYSTGQIRMHAAKGNVFRFGQSVKYIAQLPDSGDQASYALDTKSVYELRAIATAYAEIFADAANKFTQA